MPSLEALLEIQDLDLAADAARERAATLSERTALPELERKRVEIEAAIAAATAERDRVEVEEKRLGQEVSRVARDIERAELERYSGKRIDRDQAAVHDASQTALREQQAALEEQELALLEAMEASEACLSEQTAAHAVNRADAEEVASVVCKVDDEVAAELARLAEKRGEVVARVSEQILVAYERVRAQPRSGGRGAARLADARCGSCRIKLPSLEYSRMLAEPAEALIQCPQCRRVLVRASQGRGGLD